MSQSIWTRCGAERNLRRLRARPLRAVEGQHVVSTRKLVSSDEEQYVLEELLDTAKPPVPPAPEFRGLHYLLSTPFRYPPLRHGSRFGRRHERSLWYGSRSHETAFAETAYYRFLFLQGTTASLTPVHTDISTFRVPVSSDRGVDLTAGCFRRHGGEISASQRYEVSQQLGTEMRQAGVELFFYRSARDPQGGANVGLFTPAAFANRQPSHLEIWYCVTDRDVVEITRRDVLHHDSRHEGFRFQRETFEVDGALPSPAV